MSIGIFAAKLRDLFAMAAASQARYSQSGIPKMQQRGISVNRVEHVKPNGNNGGKDCPHQGKKEMACRVRQMSRKYHKGVSPIADAWR